MKNIYSLIIGHYVVVNIYLHIKLFIIFFRSNLGSLSWEGLLKTGLFRIIKAWPFKRDFRNSFLNYSAKGCAN